MKKNVIKVILGMAISVITAGSAFAGTWRTGQGVEAGKWWYDNGNGTWPANCWQWIDGDGDSIAECYYFDMNGWLYTNATTPDGHTVNGTGAWIANGVIQTRDLLNSGSGGPTGAIDMGSAGYTDGFSNIAGDMLGRSRAENAARYGESFVRSRETFVEVTYNTISFTAEYRNDEGQASYSGIASGKPSRIIAGKNETHLLFRDAPEGSSVNTCRDILRANGYDVQKDGLYYKLNIGKYTIAIKPDDKTGYAQIK